MRRANAIEELVSDRVVGDPVTAAITAAVRVAVREELAVALPRLTLRTAEVCEVLGVSSSTVSEMVRAGRLRRVEGPQSPITLVSVLESVGWPLADAPLLAPLQVVPAVGERVS